MPSIFVVDLLGTEALDEEKKILQHPNVGALILFTRNFSNPEQLRGLIKSVHSIRPDIFIAVDHEGGIVQRFQRNGFRSLPAARVYGELYDLDAEAAVKLAQKYGEIMAKDLLAYGIDLSLAPVIDLHGDNSVIGKLDRAFHQDPDVVAELAFAFIQGMHAAGMPAVGKHFPGHGLFLSDSHVSQPVYAASAQQLREVDLKPFIELINKEVLDAVMPAHVIYSAIDQKYPAGFSKLWLQDILRSEFHFRGLVMSDCLGMTGADIGNLNTRVNQALQAGCDMLIVSNQKRELLYETLQTVTFEQSTESLQRIASFKKKMMRFCGAAEEKITPHLPLTLVENTAGAPTSTSQQTEELNNTHSI